MEGSGCSSSGCGRRECEEAVVTELERVAEGVCCCYRRASEQKSLFFFGDLCDGRGGGAVAYAGICRCFGADIGAAEAVTTTDTKFGTAFVGATGVAQRTRGTIVTAAYLRNGIVTMVS